MYSYVHEHRLNWKGTPLSRLKQHWICWWVFQMAHPGWAGDLDSLPAIQQFCPSDQPPLSIYTGLFHNHAVRGCSQEDCAVRMLTCLIWRWIDLVARNPWSIHDPSMIHPSRCLTFACHHYQTLVERPASFTKRDPSKRLKCVQFHENEIFGVKLDIFQGSFLVKLANLSIKESSICNILGPPFITNLSYIDLQRKASLSSHLWFKWVGCFFLCIRSSHEHLQRGFALRNHSHITMFNCIEKLVERLINGI